MAAAPLPPVSALAPETVPLSEGARIVNTFIAPSKTFTDLRRNASWWTVAADGNRLYVSGLQRWAEDRVP